MDLHNEPDNADLARRASEGDATAFETWCVVLEGPMYGYAYRLTGNRHVAEDLVQETLLKLVALIQQGKLRGRSDTARSLVFTMLHHLAIDHLRVADRQTELDASIPAKSASQPGGSLLRDEVQYALAQLPRKQSSALTLREIGGLSYAEVADVLNMSLGEVKISIHRGRKRLAQLLDRDGQYIGARP